MKFNHAEQSYQWHIKRINNLHFYQNFNLSEAHDRCPFFVQSKIRHKLVKIYVC